MDELFNMFYKLFIQLYYTKINYLLKSILSVIYLHKTLEISIFVDKCESFFYDS